LLNSESIKPKLIRNSWNVLKQRFPRLACEIDYLRRNRNFEPDLWEVPAHCHKNQLAVDIGANTGIYSRWIAKHVQKVVSFECNPQLLPELKAFLPRNTEIHPIGLSSFKGTGRLRFDPLNTGVGTIESSNMLDQNPGIHVIEEVAVEVCTLDSFALAPVCFIKIDVEGHELEVLHGAADTLQRNRPVLLIEIEDRHRHGALDDTPVWLSQFGYRPWVLSAAGQLTECVDLHRAAGKGINNFWFRPT